MLPRRWAAPFLDLWETRLASQGLQDVAQKMCCALLGIVRNTIGTRSCSTQAFNAPQFLLRFFLGGGSLFRRLPQNVATCSRYC